MTPGKNLVAYYMSPSKGPVRVDDHHSAMDRADM